jgi:hypothetical protein
VSSYSAKQKFRPRSRDQTGGVRVTFVFGMFLALILLTSGGYLATRQTTASAQAQQDDDQIYTGSILFPGREGTECRQLLFDNRTGQFADNGTVNCDQSSFSGVNPSARVRAISRAFRDH